MRNEKQMGRRADWETGRKKLRRQTSPRLPFSLSPRLNNPQSEFRNRLNLAQAPGERARGGGREVSERALALREAEARRERVADVEARA